MSDFDKSRIERLKRALYSRNENIVPKERRTPVSEIEYDVPKDWGKVDTEKVPMFTAKRNSFFNKFLLFSLAFFTLSIGLAVFIFLGGVNMISSNNVDITFTGPSKVPAGQEIDLQLSITNQNRSNLESTSLFIEYPDGTKSTVNGTNLTRNKIAIGVLKSGEIFNYPLQAVMFGEKGTVKTIKVTLQYSVVGSNAVFNKEKDYDISLDSSPIIVNIDYSKEVNSGQDINLIVNISSNANTLISGTLLSVDYPYGFTYTDSSIKPVSGNSLWNLGDLKQGDKRTLRISGKLVGQDLEERSFNFVVGNKDSSNQNNIGTVLSNTVVTIGIRKSFFNLSARVSGSNDNTGTLGQSAGVSISWQNTLPDKIVDAKIFTTISGSALDKSAVFPSDQGFYRSSDTSVTWDRSMISNLYSILPGNSGQVSFSVGSLDPLRLQSVKNPYIDVVVKMSGTRSGALSVDVSSESSLRIKFPSVMNLESKSLRVAGPFSNTGPIPPRADKETLYTIGWTLSNTVNDLKSVSVSAVLPPNVSWKGQTSPSSEDINFDPSTRTVVWNVGNMSFGAGYSSSPKQIYFQIGLTPSLTDVGSRPALVSNVSATGIDTFTSTALSADSGSVYTTFSDSSFVSGNDTVVK